MPVNGLRVRGRWIMAAVVVCVGLAGCTGEQAGPSVAPEPTITTRTRSATITPTPSSTPRLNSGDQAAADAATAFMRMKEKLRSDPSTKIELLYSVARDASAEKWSKALFNDRVARRRQTGSFDLTLEGVVAGTSARQRVVSMCVDSTDVNLLDKDGKSLSNKDNPQRVVTVFTVDQDAKTFVWYVTKDEVTETC